MRNRGAQQRRAFVSRRAFSSRRPFTIAAIAAVAIVAGVLVVTGVPLADEAATRAASAPSAAPSVEAPAWILIDRRTGRVLASHYPGKRLAPASCSKIMTALLTLERYRDLSKMISAPAAVTQYQTVAIGLRPGDRISVRQALRALMVKSANDAAVTLAVAVAGSETRFVALMNRRAAGLGLADTHYMNCRGTPEPGHYASPRDLARLGRYAMRDPDFRDLVGTKTRTITWPPSHSVTVTSHNRLLDYPWGDGIKTGSTKQSLRVLVGSGKPGLVPLIVVTMRERTRDREEIDAVALLKWGSNLYEDRALVAAGDVVTSLEVAGEAAVDLVARTSLSAVIRKAAKPRLEFDLPAEPLPERPTDGADLGTVTYWSDSLMLGRVHLLVSPAAPSPSP